MLSIKIIWCAFWYALSFLTRIPTVNFSVAYRVYKRPISQISLYFYPLIGIIIGSVLWLVYAVATWHGSAPVSVEHISVGLQSNHLVVAALLLAAWCLITGGLHLDGLADSGDAWVGGYGDRQRTLDIMKDPTVGPMGLMLVVIVLLLKFSALVMLVDQLDGLLLLGALLGIPMLARFSIIPLFYFTPYVREDGLGSDLKRSISPCISRLITLICVGLSFFFFELFLIWVKRFNHRPHGFFIRMGIRNHNRYPHIPSAGFTSMV